MRFLQMVFLLEICTSGECLRINANHRYWPQTQSGAGPIFPPILGNFILMMDQFYTRSHPEKMGLYTVYQPFQNRFFSLGWGQYLRFFYVAPTYINPKKWIKMEHPNFSTKRSDLVLTCPGYWGAALGGPKNGGPAASSAPLRPGRSNGTECRSSARWGLGQLPGMAICYIAMGNSP
jgi:hypothetical protein